MYRVYHNGKLKSYTFFQSYEQARQFVRKLLRKTFSQVTPDGTNPIISGSGFDIRKAS